MALDFSLYTTTQLRAWVKRELKKEYGDGKVSFTIKVYDSVRLGERRLCGHYNSMKEACALNEHIFWLTHSPQGCYMVDYLLEYNTEKDGSQNRIIVIGDSKRDCYIKFLSSIKI